MTPPVTGNGMSMAFESAELAVAPLTAYSRGELSWQSAQVKIGEAFRERFAWRLLWSRWLHWMMFTPVLRGGLGTLALNSSWLWRLMYERTR
jgi:hypothetical protein